MAAKYFTIGSLATMVHHRGPTTLPGDPPAPADGPTVLCVHDVAGNGHVFTGVLDALADGNRPIAFDLPAHGRSGGLDSLGAVDAMAAHLKELADRLGVTAPVLLGDGMGAAVVIEAAATWPDWPSAVVVCGGASTTAGMALTAAIAVAATPGLVVSPCAGSRRRSRVMLGFPSMRNTIPPWPGCTGRGQLSGHGVDGTVAKY